ncbi:MAG: cytochrome C oxidase subunit IV family protein [Anaerolineae bacterium]|nr:cytochrome C oxidase subunit IV family protein [Anaerolineae bacterium]
MNSLILTFWIMTGAFIGGVVAPLITADKKMSDWLAMLIGVIVGGIGNVLLIIPLGMALHFLLPKSDDPRLAWQRDAISLAEARAALGSGAGGRGAMVSPLALLADNLWPKARQDGHSHRMSYVGVFVALAVITLVEVLITIIDAGEITRALLVALSTAKVLLVALFFMHLRYDSRWYSSIFAYALPFAALVVIVLALA